MLLPRHLVWSIVGLTVVPLALLLWLGWWLLEQHRILVGQQAQQHVERAADLVAGTLQRAVPVSEQRLASSNEQWPEGALGVRFRDSTVEAFPKAESHICP